MSMQLYHCDPKQLVCFLHYTEILEIYIVN